MSELRERMSLGAIACSGKVTPRNDAISPRWDHNAFRTVGETHEMQAHDLTRERVRQQVEQGQPGFYRLGCVVDGDFYTWYVGRSDECLQTRLMRHEWADRAPKFVARTTKSKKAAYQEECLFYHLEGDGTTNKDHPGRPDGTDLECPYCAFEQTLQETKDERGYLINNVA